MSPLSVPDRAKAIHWALSRLRGLVERLSLPFWALLTLIGLGKRLDILYCCPLTWSWEESDKDQRSLNKPYSTLNGWDTVQDSHSEPLKINRNWKESITLWPNPIYIERARAESAAWLPRKPWIKTRAPFPSPLKLGIACKESSILLPSPVKA